MSRYHGQSARRGRSRDSTEGSDTNLGTASSPLSLPPPPSNGALTMSNTVESRVDLRTGSGTMGSVGSTHSLSGILDGAGAALSSLNFIPPMPVTTSARQPMGSTRSSSANIFGSPRSVRSASSTRSVDFHYEDDEESVDSVVEGGPTRRLASKRGGRKIRGTGKLSINKEETEFVIDGIKTFFTICGDTKKKKLTEEEIEYILKGVTEYHQDKGITGREEVVTEKKVKDLIKVALGRPKLTRGEMRANREVRQGGTVDANVARRVAVQGEELDRQLQLNAARKEINERAAAQILLAATAIADPLIRRESLDSAGVIFGALGGLLKDLNEHNASHKQSGENTIKIQAAMSALADKCPEKEWSIAHRRFMHNASLETFQPQISFANMTARPSSGTDSVIEIAAKKVKKSGRAKTLKRKTMYKKVIELCRIDDLNERNKKCLKILKIRNSKGGETAVVPKHLALEDPEPVEMSNEDAAAYQSLDMRAMAMEKELAKVYHSMAKLSRVPNHSKFFGVHLARDGLTRNILAAHTNVKQRLGLVELVAAFYGNTSQSRRRRGAPEMKYGKHLATAGYVDNTSEGEGENDNAPGADVDDDDATSSDSGSDREASS